MSNRIRIRTLSCVMPCVLAVGCSDELNTGPPPSPTPSAIETTDRLVTDVTREFFLESELYSSSAQMTAAIWAVTRGEATPLARVTSRGPRALTGPSRLQAANVPAHVLGKALFWDASITGAWGTGFWRIDESDSTVPSDAIRFRLPATEFASFPTPLTPVREVATVDFVQRTELPLIDVSAIASTDGPAGFTIDVLGERTGNLTGLSRSSGEFMGNVGVLQFTVDYSRLDRDLTRWTVRGAIDGVVVTVDQSYGVSSGRLDITWEIGISTPQGVELTEIVTFDDSGVTAVTARGTLPLSGPDATMDVTGEVESPCPNINSLHPDGLAGCGLQWSPAGVVSQTEAEQLRSAFWGGLLIGDRLKLTALRWERAAYGTSQIPAAPGS